MKPDLTGLELRDAVAEGYAAAAERAGKPVPFEVAQATAQGDLMMLDAVDRNVAKKPVPKPAEQKPRTKKIDEINAELAARGDRVVRRDVTRQEAPRHVNRLTGVLRERHDALMRRLAQILETDRNPNNKFLTVQDRPYKYPALAKDYLTEHADYTFGRRGYRDLKEYDRDRKFKRAIEDIADRSTGALGPWWVK